MIVFINKRENGNLLPNQTELQEGIYYSHGDHPRNSFAMVFLRLREPCDLPVVRKTLSGLWQMYSKLKLGLVSGLQVRERDPYKGTLSVLIGYGPKLFDISGIKKPKPELLKDEWLFLPPGLGGSPILPDTGLKYADNLNSNEPANDHFVVQFIGDTQLATHRAIVETWKFLTSIKTDGPVSPIVMRTFETGFNRPDGRGWLGFHDGVSNIKSLDRLKVIQIDRKSLSRADQWTANGTYLAFLKIAIDLNIWESVPEKNQEQIVGRQKSTGCPLIGIDGSGNNIFARGCPAHNSRQVVDPGNEQFREYSPHPTRQGISQSTSAQIVKESHVQSMRIVPDRIFRQGYEFLEHKDSYPYFSLGLNFVSFQGGTDKIYRNITQGFGKVSFGGNRFPGGDKLLSVLSAGLFLVPPNRKGQQFPGDLIFQEESGKPTFKTSRRT